MNILDQSMFIVQHLFNIALSSNIINFPFYSAFHIIHDLAISTLVVHFCIFIIHGLRLE